MSLSVAIVGLPNVGKSTLFNVLTESLGAQAANFPFCTIDPNIGIVEVPDDKLEKLFHLVKAEKKVPATIEFIDVAGLVRGASKGEGLGNQFLSHIRDADAICMVLRFFENNDIIHIENSINPMRDYEIIVTELILKDMDTVKSRLDKARSNAKSGSKEAKMELELLEKLYPMLEEGKTSYEFMKNIDNIDELEILKTLHLLTAKPMLIACNIDENSLSKFDPKTVRETILKGIPEDTELVPFSAKMEEELIGMNSEEKHEFLQSYDVKSSGLERLIKKSFELLGLQVYYTAGEKEVRAWTIHKGFKAPQAAGVIHTDFEKGFIKADIVSFDDFMSLGGWKGARDTGKVRMEGKEYVMKEDDIVLFKFNV